MKRLSILLLVSGAANAQGVPVTFHLDVTPADLAVIASALQEAPYRVVQPVIDRLREQVQAQSQPKPADHKPK